MENHSDVRRRSNDCHGLPRQRHGVARTRVRLVASWQSAVAGGRGSRTHGRRGTACLRSARQTDQCSHAAKDAVRLDCPRLAPGCQELCWPPVGLATRSNGRGALPDQRAP
jgi:hypothetical protein